MLVQDLSRAMDPSVQCLREAGYPIVVATNDQQIEIIARQQRPRLGVLDLPVLGIEGPRLGRHLHALGAPPFVCLAAVGDVAAVRSSIGSGALAVLLKPVDEGHLLVTVELAIAHTLETAGPSPGVPPRHHEPNTDQKIRMAVGIFMERRGLDHHAAFQALRTHARANAQTVAAAAEQVLTAVDTLNNAAIKSAVKRRP